MSQKNVVEIDNFDVNKLTFGELFLSHSQMIAFPKYENDCVILQIPKFKITQYGIPYLGKYISSDSQRSFIKNPLDPKQENCLKIENILNKIDKFIIDNQQKILGNNYKQFRYISILKNPIELEEFPTNNKLEKNKKFEKFRFWNSQFALTYPEGLIETSIFITDPLNPLNLPIKENIKTVTEICQYLTFGSEIRMIIMMKKLWASTQKNPLTKLKDFGIKFKILQLEITPKIMPVSIKEKFSKYAFIDSIKKNDLNNPKLENKIVYADKNLDGLMKNILFGEVEDFEEVEEFEDEE